MRGMPVPDLQAIKTYRYLRIAMVALVIGLGAAVAYEVLDAGDCVKTSISAYYYTPVRPFFVSALLAIGVCLVCLQGSSPLEDALLNLAGMLAPVVALVPTPVAGPCPGDHPSPAGGSSPDVANNVTALLVVGLVAIVVTVGLAIGQREGAQVWVGIAGAVLLWLGAWAAFTFAREAFEDSAHYAAAIGMFLAIVAVVSLNALHYRTEHGGGYGNRYAVIAVSMVTSVVVVLVWKWTAGYAHWVLAIEAALIGLFAVFWLTQTVELWRRGLRSDAEP